MKRTLAIDVGGTGLKMLVLDEAGEPVTERTRVLTPQPSSPEAVVDALATMAAEHGAFDRVSVGFPGVVREGVVANAVNLGPELWRGVDFQTMLGARLGVPTRVANDADVQGYGVVEGHGVELVVTLGTGYGSALFVDGVLVPNLELGHHVLKKSRTYEELLGKAAYEEVGKKKWNRRLEEAIEQMTTTFNYRTLYLGGGNAKKVTLELPENVRVVSNVAGLLGGIALWRN